MSNGRLCADFPVRIMGCHRLRLESQSGPMIILQVASRTRAESRLRRSPRATPQAAAATGADHPPLCFWALIRASISTSSARNCEAGSPALAIGAGPGAWAWDGALPVGAAAVIVTL